MNMGVFANGCHLRHLQFHPSPRIRMGSQYLLRDFLNQPNHYLADILLTIHYADQALVQCYDPRLKCAFCKKK